MDLAHNHPPDPGTIPLGDILQRTLGALAMRTDLGGLLGYPIDGGRAAHREAGAEWIGRSGLRASAESVLVCAGSQHALTTVLATLLQPGDVLLTEAVTYPGPEGAGEPAAHPAGGAAARPRRRCGPTPSTTPAGGPARARCTSCPPSRTRPAA